MNIKSAYKMAVAKCEKNRDALVPLASVYHMLVHGIRRAWGTKNVARMRQLRGSKAPPGDCLCLIYAIYAHDMWLAKVRIYLSTGS